MKKYEQWTMELWQCEDVVCASIREELDDPNVDNNGWTEN